MNYDAAVIGAGVFGTWTAYHLRRLGLRVALADIYAPANSRASSGGESRIIRMGYGADEIYTHSAMRSLVLWKEFCARTGERIFHETGVLWTASRGDSYTEATRETLARCGVKFEILDAAEMKARYPQMECADDAWGIFEAESGALMARRAVQAVAAEAGRSGVDLKREAPREAAVFVYACGPWLPKVFPELLGKRIEVTRQEAYFFGAPPGDARFTAPAMPLWIDFSDARGPYGFPDLENRGVKIALDQHGPRVDPDTMDRVPSAEALATAREVLSARMPALRNAPLLEARVCQYENTSNGDFIIDRHPERGSVWIVGGGSGHGFKHGPAVGEYAAERIVNGGAIEPRYSLATKAETHHRTVF